MAKMANALTDEQKEKLAEVSANATESNDSKENKGTKRNRIDLKKANENKKPATEESTPRKPFVKSNGNFHRPYKGNVTENMDAIIERFGEFNVKIATLMKYNAEIRRFTALGILNWLTQKGVIKAKSKYVTFKWNKFVVRVDGLNKEFSYKEDFFINALVASFASLANYATFVINDFIKYEIEADAKDVLNSEDIDELTIKDGFDKAKEVTADSE
jgi:hypothetical protein